MRDEEEFRRDYGDQAGEFFLAVEPSLATLREWARSCLCLGPYKDMHALGGWSPLRSAEVRVKRADDENDHFFYKFGYWVYIAPRPHSASRVSVRRDMRPPQVTTTAGTSWQGPRLATTLSIHG